MLQLEDLWITGLEFLPRERTLAIIFGLRSDAERIAARLERTIVRLVMFDLHTLRLIGMAEKTGVVLEVSARLPREGLPLGRLKHFALCHQAEKAECLTVGEFDAVEFYPHGLPEVESYTAVSYMTTAVG